jgi:hypothetical protein
MASTAVAATKSFMAPSDFQGIGGDRMAVLISTVALAFSLVAFPQAFYANKRTLPRAEDAGPNQWN